MKHWASPSFWNCYEELPARVRDLADKNFEILKTDHTHPSLHVKKVGKYWSVRIGRRYRALSVAVEDGMLWFWIGTHTEYDRFVIK